MVTLETVLNVVPAVSVAIALVYYAMTINNQNKTRQAQLFMQLYDRYRSKEYMRDSVVMLNMEWTDYNDYLTKYDSSVNPDNYETRWSVWSFIDGIGMLLKKGLVNREMIYYLMGGYDAFWQWEKFKEVISELRVRMNSPDMFVMFEYLADEMRKMREQRNQTLEIPSNWGNFSPNTPQNQ